MDLETDARTFGRLLALMLGPAPVPELDPAEAAWLDDGGALRPGEDGYTHTIGAPTYA